MAPTNSSSSSLTPPSGTSPAPAPLLKTFASALNGARSRQRIKSYKRDRSESSEHPSYVDQAFKTWSNLGASLTVVKKTITDNFNDENSIGPQVLNGLSLLEKCLNDVSEMSFKMATEIDNLKHLSNKHDSVIEKNCAGGNIVSNVENSATYINSCNELKDTSYQCKILNIDLEQPLSSPSDIAKKAREILNKTPEIKDRLKNIQVIPLGKNTIIKDNCHSAPILLKSKSSDDKSFVEKALKREGYNCAFHWPKTMFKSINQIRSQVSTFQDEEINLIGKQIMIRPLESGKKLNISYREPNTSKWNLLETVSTPASEELLEKFNAKQICTSKYFVL
jgi:hypothetical protein